MKTIQWEEDFTLTVWAHDNELGGGPSEVTAKIESIKTECESKGIKIAVRPKKQGTRGTSRGHLFSFLVNRETVEVVNEIMNF